VREQKLKIHRDDVIERIARLFVFAEILPSTPRHVKVEALSEHTLQVSWQFPQHNADSVTQYEISVQHVTSFGATKGDAVTESDAVDIATLSTPAPTQGPFELQLKVK
jgi:Fibronectin type III domain